MFFELLRHPESEGGDTCRVTVEVSRPRADHIQLRYAANGRPGDIRYPSLSPSERKDELWRRTCFEAFVLTGSGGGYFELNFAPSTEWAAYRLSGYRKHLAPTELLTPRSLGSAEYEGSCQLDALVQVEVGAGLPSDRSWRLGLSTVLEHAHGGRSYWALAHPPGKPDFHHPDSFVLDLPAPA